MGSTRQSSGSPELSTRARILRAALQRFATDGLGAPLRSIAADAGVSPGLIIHHFTSADGLRQACDHHVVTETGRSKAEVLTPGIGAAALLAQLAQLTEYVPLIGYVLRRLQAGGPPARTLVDGFVAEAGRYLRQAEREGTVSRSRDTDARARLLTEQALGGLLLQLPAPGEPLDLAELPIRLSTYADRIVGPALEYYTEPLLTDSTLLDAYLANRDRKNPHSRSTAEKPENRDREPS